MHPAGWLVSAAADLASGAKVRGPPSDVQRDFYECERDPLAWAAPVHCEFGS